jgi:hypothetical protein
MVSLSYFDGSVVQSRAADIKSAFMMLSANNNEFSDSLSRATDHRKRFYNRIDLWSAELCKIGLVSELNSILAAREV